MPTPIRQDRFCVRLGPGAASDGERIGGKARSLLELAALGLPVPPAIVVTTDLFATLRANGPPLPATLAEPGALAELEQAARALAVAPWPAGFAETLAREADTLAPDPGARFSVRSSAGIEDRAGALAAGLFLSRTNVGRGELLEAVRAVLGSALSPAAVAYLSRGGLSANALQFAVLVHPFEAGDASGTAALDPAGTEPLAVEASGGARTPIRSEVRRRLERALPTIAAAHGASEVEWVAAGDRVTFLQLRPYRQTSARSEPPALPLGAGWRWDAAHNPLPLSPAQAGLVALVDERCSTGLRQKVVGGYLFYASDTDSATAPSEPAEALGALDRLAAERLALPDPTLEQALETFVAVYEPLFGVVQPAARSRRRALATFLRERGFDPASLLPELLGGVPSAAAERARRARAVAATTTTEARRTALAAYLEAFGDESPRWDVAAPTWREAPAGLERLLRGARLGPPVRAEAWREAADAIAARLPPALRDEWSERLALARAAAAVAEDDDALYARLQAHVRRALLREGARLVARGALDAIDDVFWLPLETVRRAARGERALGLADTAPLVAAARRADEEALANPPRLGTADITDTGADLLRGGAGAAGVRIGRVRRHDLHSDLDPNGTEVLVARTLLPTELPLLSPAAIVVETGGVLDHVAAQARERGIPAVVGVAGACSLLHDGDQVLVDGAAGLVVRLG